MMYFQNSKFVIDHKELENDPLVSLINSKLSNGDIRVIRLRYEGESALRVPTILKKSKFFRELFHADGFEESLNTLGLKIKNASIANNDIHWESDGLGLISNLTRKAYYGGAYPRKSDIPMNECLKMALQFVQSNINDKIDQIQVLSTYDIYWSDWFVHDYISDAHFILDHEKKEITIVLLRDIN